MSPGLFSVLILKNLYSDGLDFSSDFILPQSFFQTFWGFSKCSYYNWFNCQPHESQRFFFVVFFFVFSSLARFMYLTSFQFRLVLSLLLLLLLFIPWEFFHISVSWWSFTGVWVTASLLKSPGLFSIFWLISIFISLDGLHSSADFQVL